MTNFEKLSSVNELAKFLNKAIQDCNYCPCNNKCGGNCKSCTDKFKKYLLDRAE